MVKFSRTSRQPRGAAGQALIEYALILALLALALAIALAATGPAIAAVFSNVICNVAGQQTCGTELNSLSVAGAPNEFWLTVTWVASNPQVETPFPTPPLQPPTAVPTVGSLLPTNTSPPTETPLPTVTLGPSATPEDRGYILDFNEPADTTTRWRLDSSVYLGGDEWIGRYFPSNNFSGTPTVVSNVSIAGAQPLNIAFDWGTGQPLSIGGWNRADNFSVRWTRRIEAPAGVTRLRMTASADDQVSLYVCPSQAAAIARTGCTSLFTNQNSASVTYDISAPVWLAFEYIEYSGNARVQLDITALGRVNPDDTVASGGECSWGQIRNDDSNSREWMFDENPRSDNWPAGQTCILELRGWIDAAGVARPVLSFWDVWDLPAGATARVQVADYNADRSLMNWRDVMTRTGGTNVRNYEWTRSEVVLQNVTPALTSQRVALRFVLSSTAAANPLRWYIDDIEVKENPERTFTVRNSWDMEAPAQVSDWLYTARWQVTTTRARGGSGWEDSPARNYDRHSQGGPRIHYLELNGLVNLGASAPAADLEGDTGAPMFTFWHAYDIGPGTRLRLQYTRDARDTTTDTWIDIPAVVGPPPLPGGLILNNTTTGALTDLVMKRIQVRLNQIPNWDTQPFRLRLAMEVPAGATVRDGWWIDDISIERFGGNRYASFPFVDHAEDDAFTQNNWTLLGTWGLRYDSGILFQGFPSTRSYTDSPFGNYISNSNTSMEMSRTIDLFYDTPENTANPTTIGEPTPSNVSIRRATNARPALVFWHRRNVQSGATFAVDITTSSLADNNPMSDAEWRTIWTYVAPGTNPSAGDTTGFSRWTQNAWERVEIDLRVALEQALSTTWTALAGTTNTLDDDIRIRFRLVGGSNASDGVSIDGIRIDDLQPFSHRLWGTTPAAGSVAAAQSLGAGDGVRYDDFVETASPTTRTDPFARWYMDGQNWTVVTESGSNNIAFSGLRALHDSASGDYSNNSYPIIELQPIIDLRGVTSTEKPTLVYYQRYELASNDNARLQVSVEDSAVTTQGHGQVAGWSAWSNVISRSYTDGSNNPEMNGTTRVGWQRIQVDLSSVSFVGKRLKFRWIVNAMNDSNREDGWYIDNVSFFYNGNGAGRTTAIPVPFSDPAQSLANWIADGTWGLTNDWFRGETDTSTFSTSAWTGHWFNCSMSASGCSFNGMQTTMNSLWPVPGAAATTVPPLSGSAPSTVRREETFFIRTLLNPGVAGEGPLNGTLGDEFRTRVSVRYMREVNLTPGTYILQISHDDGLQVYLNDRTGTTISNTQNRIYNNSGGWMPRNSITTQFLTVTAASTKIMVVDFFQDGGPGHIMLNIGKLRYSFSDSPNSVSGTNYNVRNTQGPSKTSLMLNGYFNTTTLTNPTLAFYWLGQQNSSVSRFFVDVSTDGGFTWTSPWSSTDSPFLPEQNWRLESVALPSAASVMIRFRFNYDDDDNNIDGIYVTDVSVGN